MQHNDRIWQSNGQDVALTEYSISFFTRTNITTINFRSCVTRGLANCFTKIVVREISSMMMSEVES